MHRRLTLSRRTGWHVVRYRNVEHTHTLGVMCYYRAAELRPARLAAAAVGVLRDLAGSDAGRAALLRQRQRVVTCVLASLEAALPLKAMHQVQQRFYIRA